MRYSEYSVLENLPEETKGGSATGAVEVGSEDMTKICENSCFIEDVGNLNKKLM